MTPRTKALIGSAATVVIIAAVILGLWAFGSARKVTAPTITVSPQERSNQALKEGLAALSKEETGTAIELFQSAIRINPDNAAAKKALADAQSGNSSGSNTTNNSSGNNTGNNQGSTTTTSPPPAVVDPVWQTKLDIAKLLPKSYADYSLGNADVAGAEAVVSASPSRAGAPVTSVVWAVHDKESDASAAGFIKNTSKSLYSHDAKAVAVGGVSGYFGTDGKRLATVVFVRGRYVFEVLITTTGKPATQQAFAEKAAAAFPTKP